MTPRSKPAYVRDQPLIPSDSRRIAIIPKRSSGNDNDGHACDRQNDAQHCEPSNFALVHGGAGEVHGAEQQGRAEKHDKAA